MRLLIAALLLSISAPALADNIAGCEVVLMETIKQEGLEGTAEVASFRPAEDFIASIYDDETEILREIDGLPIRAIMCKRKSVIPSLQDFSIVATGTPFMISQNFESSESGLTTIYFKNGEFRSSYKGPDLDEDTAAEITERLEAFNLQPHDLAAKEKTMLEKKTPENEAKEDVDEEEVLKDDETSSTDEAKDMDDTETESIEEETTPTDDDPTESGEDKEKSE